MKVISSKEQRPLNIDWTSFTTKRLHWFAVGWADSFKWICSTKLTVVVYAFSHSRFISTHVPFPMHFFHIARQLSFVFIYFWHENIHSLSLSTATEIWWWCWLFLFFCFNWIYKICTKKKYCVARGFSLYDDV